MDAFESAIVKGDIVELFVNKDGKRKSFFIHRDLLYQYSTSLKVKAEPQQGDPNANMKDFSQYDADALQAFVLWLYRKNLPEMTSEDEKSSQREVHTYVHLYFMAMEWEIIELRNKIVDKLRNRSAQNFDWFPETLMGDIYTRTKPACPLRSFLVDTWVYWCQFLDGEEYRQQLIRQMRYSKDFVVDVCLAMLEICARSKIKDPFRKTGCVYHDHDRELCYLVQ